VGFSVKRKLLLLLAGMLIPVFAIVIVAIRGVTEYQQVASGFRTAQGLLAEIGQQVGGVREKLAGGAQAFADRGDIVAGLALLAPAQAEHLRPGTLEAEKRRLADALDKYANALNIQELDLFDGAGRLVAFARRGTPTRLHGTVVWRDCLPQLVAIPGTGGQGIEVDRPAGMHTLIENLGSPASAVSRFGRRDDGLGIEALVPVQLTGNAKARRVGWVRAALGYSPAAATALARQRGLTLSLLFSGRFDLANPLGLRPSQLESAWPLLGETATASGTSPSWSPLAAEPRFDSAVLPLDNGENLWFVAAPDPALADAQRAGAAKVLIAVGAGLLLILALAYGMARRWFGEPLARLREGVAALAGGRREPPLVTLTGDDEFAELGQEINALAENLHRQEVQARDVEERLALALEGSGHAAWTLDAATGAIEFDPAWQHILGYAATELPHNLAGWRALIHPDDQSAVRTAFESQLSGASAALRNVCRVRAQSGEYRWVMTRGRLQRDAQGRPRRLVGSGCDVTEQRHLHQKLRELMAALRESESHFRRFFDEARAVMLLIDPADGRIIEANPAASAFYGYSHDELLALHIADINLMTQDDVMNEMTQALAAGREQSIHPHRLKDGTTRTVEVFSSPYQYDRRLVIYTIVHDISERAAAERSLREAATVFDATTESIMVTDLNGVIKRINPAFTQMTGYAAAEAIGQSPRILKSGRQDAEYYRAMWQRLLSQGRWEGELWNRRKDGSIFPVWQSISPVRDAAGKVTGFVSLFIDITQKKRTEEDIAYRANYDALTGLPNRNLLAERLGQALKQARRENSRVAVMFVDLDYFKQVNDTLGHAVGDRLLQLVAERMRMCVRETDTIARMGGDEFVILLMDIDAAAPAGIVADKLLTQMAEVFSIEGNEIHIGASIGITLFPDDGRDVDTLFRNADLAMYRAKSLGRNNAQFFEIALTTAAVERRALETDLREAVARNQLRLHYQPLVDLATHRIVGVEALLRWQHPQRGLLAPAQFIQIAEETGLIREIGQWAFAAACHQVAAWQAGGHALSLALNVSARQLPEPLSVSHIVATLARHGIEPQQLVLEIGEAALLSDSPSIQQWFAAAGAAGLRLAIDDFGTGYSSLAYLKRFPVQQVKIDKDFVRRMEDDSGTRALVEAILAMAHSLGLAVVAEGVENPGQAGLLRARACELAQGYLYSEPLGAAEMGALLGNQPM